MRTRVGRSEESLLAAIHEPDVVDARVGDVVKRLRPAKLRRLLAMTPAERLDRALALTATARDMGNASVVRRG